MKMNTNAEYFKIIMGKEMHSSFGLPYPAGHWMYSLYDLLDNSVFVVCFFAFWVATGQFLLRTVHRKFNIPEMVEFLSFFINDTNESVFLFLRNIKDLSLIRNGELVYHEVNKSELL